MSPSPDLLAALRQAGFVFVLGEGMRGHLAAEHPDGLSDWPAFAASWNDLQLDRYMADGGRYRRRRHALYAASATGPVTRAPHGPHWQAVDYNPLNGGVERWFEPVTDEIGASHTMTTILAWCHDVFQALAPATPEWKIEVHQFRIEARANEAAKPTPEGPHRDGVDYVLVLMIQRTNIASGTTTVHALDGRELGSFTLSHPFDAALVDDPRVHHGVTPVEPHDPALPAYRDVLVVTFKSTAIGA